MAIWVIITTSLINQMVAQRDYATRKGEYITGITKILEMFKGYNIVIVENTSLLTNPVRFAPHSTFLDKFNVPVLYTRTNSIITKNYGMKELFDILECIKRFNIQDDDFIVKVTGRYILKDDSEFVKEVHRLEETNYDALIRYGPYSMDPPEGKSDNCVSGLIGLRCKYVKEIEIPDDNTFIEHKWARKIAGMDESKVHAFPYLGIYIRPAGHLKYFLV